MIERLLLMTERLLTARELAELLGFQPGTIVDWYEQDKLPGFRLGGKLRFYPPEVAEWLDEHRGNPARHASDRLNPAWVHSPAAPGKGARTVPRKRHRPDSIRDLQGGHEP